ncbi:hypothetical protein NSB04_05190 [Blautia pseudococcoides]|nr:hypothetical protein [Blautia pseudococcoides]
MQCWRWEFRSRRKQINGILTSLWSWETGRHWNILSALSLLATIMKTTDNWLAFVNRTLVNAGFGTLHPVCVLSSGKLCYTFFITRKKGAAAMIQKKNPEDVAAKRMQLITPLLDPALDHQQLVELKKQIC